MADDCTKKQLKISYAKVLVEVDITKQFVKDIKVRDNIGREFTQRAIPKWRLFFCHRCNKLSQECKENYEAPCRGEERKRNKNVDTVRHLNRSPKNNPHHTKQEAASLSIEKIEGRDTMGSNSHKRDVIPENPFDQ